MTASSSKQPHNSSSTLGKTTSLKGTKITSRKGKGRETVLADSTNARPSIEGEEIPLWNWVSLTDSCASKFPPVFTKDGSYFFSLVGSSVKVHSTITGQIVSTLTAPCPEGKESRPQVLTCAILSPRNAFQLITGSLNGCIAIWDFMNATLLQVIDIEKPVHYLSAHRLFQDAVFVTATKANKRGRADESALVLRISLLRDDSSTKLVQKAAEVITVGKTRSPAGLSLSPSGEWLVAIAGHTSYVAATSALQSGFTKYVSPERLTCLAFHPSEEYFATGDDKGCVRLWYCLNNRQPVEAVGVEKKSQTTTFHWHAHAVASIAFTSNGAYLLSGGEESVLVVWQLHTSRKEFVPRVGAPISTIAVLREGNSSEEYLLGLTDATYVFINPANLKISRTFSRMKLEHSSSPSNSTPLVIHNLTSTIILPSSHPSSLQIYAPTSSKLISEIEVSPSNRVSRRDDKPIEPHRVGQAAIATSGDWMATIDSRNGDDAFRSDVYLKFWKWDRKSGFWILNTRIDRPHGWSQIRSMSFKPAGSDSTSLQLVTTGADFNVKIWRIRSIKASDGAVEESWVTRSVTKYKGYLPSHAAWSPDGSLLAISCGLHIALYEPVTNALVSNLTSQQCKEIISLHFIGKSGRFLASLSKSSVTLWDLVNQTVRWHFKSHQALDFLVTHSARDSFALLSKPVIAGEQVETRIWIFDASSSAPTSTRRIPHALRNVMWYSLPLSFPVSTSSFRLVGITQTWSVILMGDDIQLDEGEGSTGRGLFGELGPKKRTVFQDIFGKSVFSEPSTAVITRLEETSGLRIGTEKHTLMDEPAYLMPSLDSIFDRFVGSITKERAAPLDSIPDDANVDIAVVDEVDADTVISRPQNTRIVDNAEMLVFIDLFKRHAVSPARSVPANGAATRRVNGIVNGKANGSNHLPYPLPVQNGHSSTPNGHKSFIATATNLPSSPTPLNGKKRKKSPG